MALPAWPTGLDATVDLGQFKILEATRPVIWTEFEDGPPLGRSTGGGRRARLQYRINVFHDSDLEAFRAFHETTLVDGTSRFTMPVWRPATGIYETRTVMLDKGAYTVDPFGLGWSINFVLIVFDW